MRAFSPLMRRPWAVLAAAVAVVVIALVRLGAGGETVSGHSITSTPGVPQFHVEIDTIQDGSTFCEPVNDTSTEVFPHSHRVAVCVKDPPAAIGAFQFDLVYDDTLNTAPEVANVGLALDDNPDANEGATTWPNSTTGDDLGSGWDCSGFGVQYPTGDTDAGTGPGHGRAKIVCLNLLGPWTLGDNETEGVLATVEFNVIGLGADTLHLENVEVADTMGGEMGSCNPAISVPIPCFDATESKVTPTPTPPPTYPPTPTPGNSITSPDTGGNVGRFTSLVLDASGNPVVSYVGNAGLKVLHCNDPNCAGGDESITFPDTGGVVAAWTSLALDASGKPVVSYFDNSNYTLKVLHCNDANCAGGDESITSPDKATGWEGYYSSLALDASGYPVVSYNLTGVMDLKLLHCNDANCAGEDESITSPDTGGQVGEWTSLALDASGYPVVSYRDTTRAPNTDLKVLHCNDPNCAGGGESITFPDMGGQVGEWTSLALDASGYPVVSYYDYANHKLKVMHCNDANCAAGGESITSPDTGSNVGEYTSLVLDGSGKPVVSYYDHTNANLKVLHCGNANCTSANSIRSPDTAGDVGQYTSLALDSSGNPVVSYYDATNGVLKLLHCDNANCAQPPTPTPTATLTATPTPWPTPTPTPIPVMSHLAGTGVGGYNPEDEGQPAAGAQVNGPQGMFDTGTADTIYFADTNNHRIRKITGNGIIYTVAGGNPQSPKYCGDGGPATSACLNYPRDVFLDSDHNIYVADTENHRIRVVNTQAQVITVAGVTIQPGYIETVAGGGSPTPGFCGDGGSATSACLDTPSGVAVDEAGNIYIADTKNHRIRRVDASGTITTFVGSGTGGDYAGDGGPATLARLNLPHDVYPYGSMYAGTTDLLIADTGNNVIRWVHGPSGIINTLAGNGTAGSEGDDGPAIEAHLYAPEAVAADASLAVFVADTENNRIRRFGFGEATITTFAGGGSGCDEPCPAKDSKLDHPAGVAAAGTLVIANTGGAALSDVDPATGEPVGSFGNSAACNTGVATADCVFVVLALGLILVRKQVRALLVRIRSAAGLAPGRRTTG
jgi:sugar lactone lactonase YvrE